MKNVPFARSAFWGSLLGILLCVGARADEVTANFTNGRGNGVWEVDYFTNGTSTLADDMPANWSTLAYPDQGHSIVFPTSDSPAASITLPSASPTYDVSIGLAAPVKLGIAVKINSLSVASGSALNVQPGGILEVLSGFANDGQVTFAGSTSKFRLTQDNVNLLGTGTVSLGGGAIFELPAGIHASNSALHTLRGDGASQSINGTLQLDGTLTNNGTLILGASSTVSIGISGTGTHFGVLANSVPVVLGGNLDLRLLNGFAPSTSDSFTVVTSSAPITGAFANVASGARFITADRKYSLLVNYGAGAPNPNAVVLTGLQALTSDDLPVTINPPGDGTVTKGFLPKSNRVYGKSYTIVATPKPGFVFAGWTGSSTASGASLTFTMAPGFHLTANFVADPFGPVLGTYNGLGTSSSNEGLLSLTMTKAGNFSAKFTVAGVTYRFKGQFNGNGAFDGTFTVAGTPVVVHLTAGFMTAADTVSGTISISGVSYAIGADRDVFTKTNPAPTQGVYTIDLPPNADNSDVNAPRPQGDGWATATVGATGNVTMAGTLADGTKFSAAGVVSKTGVFPVYAALYQKLGAVVGTLTFAGPPRSGASDVTGTIFWSKPVQPATSIFPHAFNTDLTAAGSFYPAPPASVRAQLGLPVNGHGTLAFIGGNLSPDLTEAIVISSANKVTTPVPGALPDKLNVTFNVKAGTFTGTFLHNTTEKVTAFSGVLLPKQQIGRGFFLGSTDSGKVQLGP